MMSTAVNKAFSERNYDFGTPIWVSEKDITHCLPPTKLASHSVNVNQSHMHIRFNVNQTKECTGDSVHDYKRNVSIETSNDDLACLSAEDMRQLDHHFALGIVSEWIILEATITRLRTPLWAIRNQYETTITGSSNLLAQTEKKVVVTTTNRENLNCKICTSSQDQLVLPQLRSFFALNGRKFNQEILSGPKQTISPRSSVFTDLNLFLLALCVLLTVSAAQDIDLRSSLTASGKGFRVLGTTTNSYSGRSASAAGDVNNDGIADVVIGAYQADPLSGNNAGISYVIFGGGNLTEGAAPFKDIQLTTGATAISPSIGFRILGAATNDWSGYSVNAAGDVNNDDIDDIIVGAPQASPLSGADAGIAYVIFGRDIPGGAPAFGDIQLTIGATLLSAEIGFRILGAAITDNIGNVVRFAGDVNGDGISDVILGSYAADPPSGSGAGISYVIFGRNITAGAAPFGDIQLTTGVTPLAPSIGFRILGAAAADWGGYSVSAAGDVNGDGVGDIIVGANNADPTSGSDAGISYVIFGRNITAGAAPFGEIQLTTGVTPLAPSIGFRILGAAASDSSGQSVSAAGDVNGDGVGDIIVGANNADPPSGLNAGIAYVIFGRDIPGGAAAFSDIQLSTTALSPNIGFRILGAAAGDLCGNAVSAAGDVNNDGIDDVLIGARSADSPGGSDAGISYVIFGRDIAGGATPFGDIQLTSGNISLPSNTGFRILGAAATDSSGYSVSAAGDVNRDGIDDIIIGANNADLPGAGNAGISYVVFGVDWRPTSQPSSQPSRQPSSQPLIIPTSQPSVQPLGHPTAQPSCNPSMQPSYQPFAIPTLQPSSQPSTRPSAQPSAQPSQRPSIQPSSQPSTRPSAQPSVQPSRRPSVQPSTQPSTRPSAQPSTQPLVRPSTQPSLQPLATPSAQPSAQPLATPSAQPSAQPLATPSAQPSVQPSRRPSIQPSSQPSTRPSAQPSTQPSNKPSAQPSSQPFVSPSTQPSAQPLAKPSTQPSLQPSTGPSAQPSLQPSTGPSAQPSSQPSYMPSAQPSWQPSTRPSAQPSSQPLVRPSAQPSSQPSNRPSAQPSSQPSNGPGAQPSSQPSNRPTAQPSLQPSSRPSAQPSSQPSDMPSAQPSSQPSTRPSAQPSLQPSSRPSMQPSMQPSTQPISTPSFEPTGMPVASATVEEEWAHALANSTHITSGPTSINHNIWACYVNYRATFAEPYCAISSSVTDTPIIQHRFYWTNITTILPGGDLESVHLSGMTVRDGSILAELATCTIGVAELSCTANSYLDTKLVSGSYSPTSSSIIYIGEYNTQALIMILRPAATDTLRSYLYLSTIMKTVTFLHIQSPPNYIGSFVAGTCANIGQLNNIFAGMLRTDSGTMAAMYVTPVRGSILNSAELVNAMALEYVNPNSFIAGGLQVSGEADMQAYLLCVNSIFRRVVFGVRYVLVQEERRCRSLQEARLNSKPASVAKGMIVADNFLFLVIAYYETQRQGSTSVLKVDMATGNILQQVQFYSDRRASIQCNGIAVSGLSLVMACTVSHPGAGSNSTQAVVVSMSRELEASQLPEGFRRYENETFTEESMAFKPTLLPMVVQDFKTSPFEYSVDPTDGNPTRSPSATPSQHPSKQPSRAPSGLPSSSPTSAPSVSSQPTSQPSTSGPTNTYKPTVKPTQRPSRVPSRVPTVSPSVQSTTAPTVQTTLEPSASRSAQPSAPPTIKPTRSLTIAPTRTLITSITRKPTATRSEAPTVSERVGTRQLYSDQAYAIVGYGSMGLFGLWLLYYLRQWCSYELEGVQSDANRALYAASMGVKPKPRFPIVSFLARQFVTVKGVELDFIVINNDARMDQSAEVAPSAELISLGTYHGFGAYMDGPADFRDLEANTSRNLDANGAKSEANMTTTEHEFVGQKTATSPQENAHVLSKKESESDISSLSSKASSVSRSPIAAPPALDTMDSEESFDTHSASDSTVSDTDSDTDCDQGENDSNHQTTLGNDGCVGPEVLVDAATNRSDSVDYSFPSSLTEEDT